MKNLYMPVIMNNDDLINIFKISQVLKNLKYQRFQKVMKSIPFFLNANVVPTVQSNLIIYLIQIN